MEARCFAKSGDASEEPRTEWTGNGRSMHGVAWLRPEPRRSGVAIFWTAKQWSCKEKRSAATEL